MKRIALVAVLALLILVAAAPEARADHCYRCKVNPVQCALTSPAIPGYSYCVVEDSICHLTNPCGPHAAAIGIEPLASEYRVMAVEREGVVVTAQLRGEAVSAAAGTRR